MIGWCRQSGDRKAHVVTDARELIGPRPGAPIERVRIGTVFNSLCPWDVQHIFERDDYEWMAWGWLPTAEEACWICWRRIAMIGGFEYPV